MKKVPERELARRARGLQERVNERGVDFCLFAQKADRYYLSGTVQDGVCLVPREGEPVLFVRRTFERALEESSLKTILPYDRYEDIRAYVKDNGIPCGVIGLEMDILPARFYLSLVSLFPGARFEDVSMDIRGVRSVKSPWEISLMREAGARLDRVFDRIGGEIRPGMTERDLFAKFSGLLLDEGAVPCTRTRAFNMEVMPPYVLSGKSAARFSAMDSPSGGGDGVSVAYPFGAGARRLREGDPITIDTSLVHEGYISDCTRVFAIGQPDEEFCRAHGVSAECHDHFRERAEPGVFIPDLFKSIRALVEKRGLDGTFMGGLKFIGHGVGLELDELPLIAERFEERLAEGMVIAFEPKFIFPGGTVGYENTYCLEDGRPVSFNSSEPGIRCV
jgi:Xaa-Pro aminopeptidase